MEKKLIVITGPTAAGKTAVAIHLAKRWHTEIISADSRQIYTELNIGTAKPSDEELAAVPHHFINCRSIQLEYDAAQYGRDALNCIHKLFERHDRLILCGGSGLYIKAVCEGFDDIPDVSIEIRKELVARYKDYGIQWLQQELKRIDSEHFSRIDQFNTHRLMRALEVKMGTGLSISTFQKKNTLEHPFKIIKIGLELNREELFRRIDSRMDAMISQGLFEEVKTLLPFRNHNALQTVGYKEIFDYIDNMYSYDEAVRLLKRNSRRYAKRQLTWFKKDPDIVWLSLAAALELNV